MCLQLREFCRMPSMLETALLPEAGVPPLTQLSGRPVRELGPSPATGTWASSSVPPPQLPPHSGTSPDLNAGPPAWITVASLCHHPTCVPQTASRLRARLVEHGWTDGAGGRVARVPQPGTGPCMLTPRGPLPTTPCPPLPRRRSVSLFAQ